MTLSSRLMPARVPEAVELRPDSNRHCLVSSQMPCQLGNVCTPPSSGAGSASGGVRTRASRLEAGQAAADLTNAITVQSRRLESNQLLRIFSAALLPSQLRRDHPVPRQGIEPCVCRLKAGGFAVEACEASV